MKQAIPGLSLSGQREVTAQTVWPSVSATSVGRFWGRLYEPRGGFPVFNLGTLFLVLSIPVVLPIYLWYVLPGVGTRYRITNRRVVAERGMAGRVEREISLEQFDRIEIEQFARAGLVSLGRARVFRERPRGLSPLGRALPRGVPRIVPEGQHDLSGI